MNCGFILTFCFSFLWLRNTIVKKNRWKSTTYMNSGITYQNLHYYITSRQTSASDLIPEKLKCSDVCQLVAPSYISKCTRPPPSKRLQKISGRCRSYQYCISLLPGPLIIESSMRRKYPLSGRLSPPFQHVDEIESSRFT